MSYVDGFVAPVPQENLAAYRRMAREAGEIWREHGALEYIESVADDVQRGKSTSFPQAVQLKEGEVVVLPWIAYSSRKPPDRSNKLVMSDPRLADMMDPKSQPFDDTRIFFGSFKTLVKLWIDQGGEAAAIWRRSRGRHAISRTSAIPAAAAAAIKSPTTRSTRRRPGQPGRRAASAYWPEAPPRTARSDRSQPNGV